MRRAWPLTVRGTGALVLAVACFVVAGELGLIELVYFGVLLIVVLAASVASLYVTRRTESIARSLSPDSVAVGGRAQVTVLVAVRTAVPSPAGVWRDTVPRGLSGNAHGGFPSLGSGLRGGQRSVMLEYTVIGMRRGIHSLGPLSVTSSDPFGLARRSNVLGPHTRVTVTPESVELAALTNFAGDTGGTLQSTTNHLGQGSDNLIARPYASGDSMRRIHWRATAHRDTLMVRQEEQESTPEATVVLDRGALRWTQDAMRAAGTDEGFEVAVSACISTVARLVRDGYSVEVIDSDGTPLTEPIDGGDMSEVETFSVQLATLVARRDDHLSRLTQLFAGSTTGPVVVITGRFDTADADALAPLVHRSTLPILLAVSPVGDALDHAAEDGWRTAAIGPDADLAAAWATAAEVGVSGAIL